MKNILHVIDTTGPGGAETIFLQLAQHTSENGYKSIALIRGNGWVQSQLEQIGIPFFVIDCKGSFNIKYLFQMIELIKRENIDIIQSHLLGSSVYSSIASLITKTKLIVTFHGLVDIKPDESHRFLKLLALKFGSNKIVAVTETLNKKLRELSIISPTKIITIYNGIDCDLYKKIDSETYKKAILDDNENLLIGSLGNIRKPKNYSLAIDTINELHFRGIRAHYAIAGDGSETQMQPLRDLISKYELENHVHLLGFTDCTQLFLSSLDIFLMTSTSEGHPLALTQAMANQLPIISTRSGVEQVVTHEKEALISEDHTAIALADEIEKLITHDNLLARLPENAYKKVTNNYSLEAMLRSYFNLYDANIDRLSTLS